jgi:hypothetical protein
MARVTGARFVARPAQLDFVNQAARDGGPAASSWLTSSSVKTRLRVRNLTPSGASTENPEPRPGTPPPMVTLRTVDGFSVCFSIPRQQQNELGEALVAQPTPEAAPRTH